MFLRIILSTLFKWLRAARAVIPGVAAISLSESSSRLLRV